MGLCHRRRKGLQKRVQPKHAGIICFTIGGQSGSSRRRGEEIIRHRRRSAHSSHICSCTSITNDAFIRPAFTVGNIKSQWGIIPNMLHVIVDITYSQIMYSHFDIHHITGI
ncbi:unnamed protein product [Nesidiocoris tenuis]|uniref:Uncharacterized protein n=1 Tax=Nesidiocoris tenuis TaxID=355587 RepID=A0A6H5GDV9_9HEMI|nr:unnamed protein product [Nesidiocoris tenuis]